MKRRNSFADLILFKIRLNLRFPFGAESWLVDGQEDHLVVVSEDDAVQPTVDSTDIVSNKLCKLVKALRK
jgi:hypothetical protein